MTTTRSIGTTLLDGMTGLVAVLLLATIAVLLHTIHSAIGAAGVVGAVLFAFSWARQLFSGRRPLFTGLAVGLGAALPVALVAMDALHAGYSPLFWAALLGLLAVCVGGSVAQRLWSRKRQGLSLGVAAVGLVLVLLLGKGLTVRLGAASTQAGVDVPAPPFSLTAADGSAITGASLQGKVVVMDFWGTWCAPCLAEMPGLNQVYEQFRGNPQVQFLAVNPGLRGDTPARVRAFAAKRHMTIPVAFTNTGTLQSFGGIALPFVVILDQHGHIRVRSTGFEGAPQLRQLVTTRVQELLAAQ